MQNKIPIYHKKAFANLQTKQLVKPTPIAPKHRADEDVVETNNLEEMRDRRLKDNYWHRTMHFYCYVILLGNTLDYMPFGTLLANILSTGVYNLAHLLGALLLVTPMVHIETLYGYYTRLTNTQMFRMASVSFGLCMLMFVLQFMNLPQYSFDVVQLLETVLILIIRPDILSGCPKNAVDCYSFTKAELANSTCRSVFMGLHCEPFSNTTVRYSVLYGFWRALYSNPDMFNWNIMIISFITWICVASTKLFSFKTQYHMLLVLVIIHTFFNALIFSLALGNVDSFVSSIGLLFQFDFNISYNDFIMAMVSSTFKLGILRSCGYMTSTTYLKEAHYRSGMQIMTLILFNYLLHIWHLLVVLTIQGVVAGRMGVKESLLVTGGAPLYISAFVQFLFGAKFPLAIILIYCLSLWFLEILKLSIQVHLIVVNIVDFMPILNRYAKHIAVLICLAGLSISIIHSFSVIMVHMMPLMVFARIYLEQTFLVLLQSTLLFYCYGIYRICDDIHFITGNSPLTVWRAYCTVYPVINLILLIILALNHSKKILLLLGDFNPRTIGYTALMFSFYLILTDTAIIMVSSFLYMAVQIKRKTPAVDFFKPQFHFGPPDAATRIERKLFRPNTSMRSQIVKKRVIRYRKNALPFQHRIDHLQGFYQGRVFLEEVHRLNFRLANDESFTTPLRHNVKSKGHIIARLLKYRQPNGGNESKQGGNT